MRVQTSVGGTVSLVAGPDDLLLVVLDHPEAPEDMRHLEAGRIIHGGFQPAPFAEYGLRPETLRIIAALIEDHEKGGE